MAIFGFGQQDPYAEAEQAAQDRQTAFAGMRDNLPALGLIAGLSMLARNNGSRSVGQLIGQAGGDALNAYGTWRKMQDIKDRQAQLDKIAAEEREYARSQDAFRNDMALKQFGLQEAKMAQDMQLARQRMGLAYAGLAAQRQAQALAAAKEKEQAEFDKQHRQVNGVWYDLRPDGKWEQSKTLNMFDLDGNMIGGKPQEQIKPSDFNTLKSNYDKESSDYLTAGRSLQNVFSLVQNPSMTDDLALIYNFQRANDPGSVVRETEFDMAQRSGSLWDQARAKLNEMTGGGRLTQEQRMDILKTTRKLYAAQENKHRKRVAEYWGVVLPKMGLSTKDIINTSYYGLLPDVDAYIGGIEIPAPPSGFMRRPKSKR